jgi:hypothetical protein
MQRESVLVTREKFRQVPEETSVVPFWFWNKDLRKTELKLQLVEMKSQGVLEAMIHARRGLEIEYLSEEWFDRVEFTLQESRKMGLKMWVYDEDNWPSGYAGGRVLKVNPDYRGKCLHMMKMKAEDLSTHETNGHVIAVVAGRMVDQRIEPSSLRDITSSVLETGSWLPLEGDWIVYVFVQRYISWKPAYSEERYVDLIDPAAVKCFIDLTYEEYARRFGEYFGNTLKGFFTDEPGFYNNFHPPTQIRTMVGLNPINNPRSLPIEAYGIILNFDDHEELRSLSESPVKSPDSSSLVISFKSSGITCIITEDSSITTGVPVRGSLKRLPVSTRASTARHLSSN